MTTPNSDDSILKRDLEWLIKLRKKNIVDLNYCYVKGCNYPAIKYFENKNQKTRRFYCDKHIKSMLKQEAYKNWDLKSFNYKDYKKVNDDNYINILEAISLTRQECEKEQEKFWLDNVKKVEERVKFEKDAERKRILEMIDKCDKRILRKMKRDGTIYYNHVHEDLQELKKEVEKK